ncbi:hypothetical protein AYI69_g7928 [Smittium culicis]|uniref:Uncharacterized protein n=1 Tax=Smittium culicis TaxID=133412 RepID=A0A1R1XNJ0_9FUNG|nr:hypothetical protein AYI69_g7928 [Smittium culicis]
MFANGFSDSSPTSTSTSSPLPTSPPATSLVSSPSASPSALSSGIINGIPLYSHTDFATSNNSAHSMSSHVCSGVSPSLSTIPTFAPSPSKYSTISGFFHDAAACLHSFSVVFIKSIYYL